MNKYDLIHSNIYCEDLKNEIKLSKEMLIYNTSETDKQTLPQIIEQFMYHNLIDQQDDEGYTIPVFVQIEEILEAKENTEEQNDILIQLLNDIKNKCKMYNNTNNKLNLDIISMINNVLEPIWNKQQQKITQIKNE